MAETVINNPVAAGSGRLAAMVAGAGLAALGQTADAAWMVTTPVTDGLLQDDFDTLDLDIDGDSLFDVMRELSKTTLYGKYYNFANLNAKNSAGILGGGNPLNPQDIVDNYITGSNPLNLIPSYQVKDYGYDYYAGGQYVDDAFSGTLGLSLSGGGFGYVSIESTTGYDGVVEMTRYGLWKDPTPRNGVPTPGSLALLASGAAGVVAMRRRRSKATD